MAKMKQFGLVMILSIVAGFSCGDVITIQGPSDTDDATLRAYKPDTTYGGGTSLIIDGRYGNSTYWSCLRFELPALSEDEYVSNVALELYYSGVNGTGTDTVSFDLTRALNTWVESEVTWNSASSGTPWSGGTVDAQGGDPAVPLNYDTTSLGSISLSLSTEAGWQSFTSAELATILDGMCHETVDNNGFIINRTRDYTDNNAYYFYSSDYTDDTSLQPKLTLTIDTIPEPTTSAVVAIGGLLGLIKRKK